MWNATLYLWLGSFIRSQMFQVSDGNDDWGELVNPETYGLEHAQNIYLASDSVDDSAAGETFDPDDKIGAWWIRAEPKSGLQASGEVPKEKPSDKYTKILHDMPDLGARDTVFILLHGNAKNRGASHRIAAYKLFQRHGYHTLTLDYRGWGDSVMAGGVDAIVEQTLIDDAKLAVKFVRKEVGNEAKLVLYGHSMGTGIASRVAAECNSEALRYKNANSRVDGVILDSPFYSLKNAFENIPYLSKMLSFTVDTDKLLEAAKVRFDSPKWLASLKVPVTIFSADCDPVTPPHLAEKLVADVKANGKKDISLIKWTEEGLGHIGISKTKSFPKHVREFVKRLHDKDDKKSKL